MTPDALAALCAAVMPEENLTVEELTHACFGANDTGTDDEAVPDEIFGDERGVAVMQTHRFGEHVAAWLVLVAVHPDEQSRGKGKALVGAVAKRAREIGAPHLMLASAIPRYLWPGVDTANTRAGMLLETLGFERDWVATNMTIDSSFRRTPPAGVIVERETGSGAHDLAAAAFPHWVPELDRAVSLGTAFAARDAGGATIGFGCHSVTRAGWIGPMATDPTLQHGGVGSAVLAGVWPAIESGDVSPVIDRVLPLDAVADAHRLMESSEHVGKILLTT